MIQTSKMDMMMKNISNNSLTLDKMEVDLKEAIDLEKQESVKFIIANAAVYLIISLCLFIYVCVFLFKYYQKSRIEKENATRQVTFEIGTPPATRTLNLTSAQS